MILGKILKESIDRKASDVIIAVDSYPYLKIDGEMVPLESYGVLSKEVVEQEVYGIMSERQRDKFEAELELDYSIDLK